MLVKMHFEDEAIDIVVLIRATTPIQNIDSTHRPVISTHDKAVPLVEVNSLILYTAAVLGSVQWCLGLARCSW